MTKEKVTKEKTPPCLCRNGYVQAGVKTIELTQSVSSLVRQSMVTLTVDALPPCWICEMNKDDFLF